MSKQKDDRTSVYCSGHAKQRNFSSVVLRMNNDQEESVSSAVYKHDTSTNAAFFENSLTIVKDINVGKFIIKKVFF